MNQRHKLLLFSFLLYLSFNSYAQVTLEAAYPTTDLHRVNWAFGGEKYWYSNDSLKEIKVFTAQHQLLKTIRYPSVLNSQIRLLQNEQAVTQTTVNGDNLLEIIWFFKDTLTKKEQMKIINEKDSVLFIFDGVSDNVQLSEIEGLPSKLFVSINDLGLDTYITKVYALPSLNLENIYFNAYRLHRKKFGYAGEKYFFQDAANKKMRLFNSNHSHWKNINLNYQNLTLYPSDNCVDADDNVFSRDSLVEVVFCYDVGINYGEAILSENGNVIYKITSNTIALDQKKGLTNLLFEEVYYSTKNNDFRVLSLPDLTVKAISSYQLSRAFLKKYGEIIYTFDPFQNQLKLFHNSTLVQKTINLPTINPNRVVYPYFLIAYKNGEKVSIKDALK